MTNKEIALHFDLLAKLMELHLENPFKIRSYQSAYRTIRSLDFDLASKSEAEIQQIQGIGKAISAKILELLETGKMATLEKIREATPVGVREMLEIKGFGPKKIRSIWKDLQVESLGELLYACNENRLLDLKGFGPKTQEDLVQKIHFFLNSKGFFHYATLLRAGTLVVEALRQKKPEIQVELTGKIRRKCSTGERVELVIEEFPDLQKILMEIGFKTVSPAKNNMIEGLHDSDIPFVFYLTNQNNFGSRLFETTGSTAFLSAFHPFLNLSGKDDFASEKDIFQTAQLAAIPPELRESEQYIKENQSLPILIEEKDIRGVLHTHSNWSDGQASLHEMVTYTQSQGYEYLGITDHSKSAFYANGLSIERVLEQAKVIREINQHLDSFRLFHGIEADILSNGDLDYPDEILKLFDFVIASIHSNLKMDEKKATERLIRAIENPYTRILGHPTGRLLLSRKGYPLDHKKIIEACAANNVVIELNANPYRLDLDWKWIPYAIEKNCMIAINPDAHSLTGIHDIQYGVAAARKGGLQATSCLNTVNLEDFHKWIQQGF